MLYHFVVSTLVIQQRQNHSTATADTTYMDEGNGTQGCGQPNCALSRSEPCAVEKQTEEKVCDALKDSKRGWKQALCVKRFLS